MKDGIVVLVTAANEEEAGRLAEVVVAERLAACVNVVGGVQSVYRWQGEICRDREQLLIIKSRREVFAKLEARLRELHSYDVPEIIALPIELGSQPYLDWIGDQVS